MTIKGSCHCDNVTFEFETPQASPEMPVRACCCSFCRKHGGVYTSHPQGRLTIVIHETDQIQKYRFGTRTADFYICGRCGVVPFVVCEIEGRLHAVVNVNSFEDTGSIRLLRSESDFDGEDMQSRLQRRARNWIPDVSVYER